jgi:hypothetical protein
MAHICTRSNVADFIANNSTLDREINWKLYLHLLGIATC